MTPIECDKASLYSNGKVTNSSSNIDFIELVTRYRYPRRRSLQPLADTFCNDQVPKYFLPLALGLLPRGKIQTLGEIRCAA
jgi:hypothetical protein